METKDVLKKIRIENSLTQEEMAERLAVTRQAVSRWENGDATPNIETLKQISTAFDVSINTLLGSPRKLFCQCCGMPLEEDGVISREVDNSFNEDYCKWCYADGQFVYKSMDELLDFLVEHMPAGNFTPEEARKYFSGQLSGLKHWKQ
ncbi:DNA-binding helix-turn-helix protein [Marvinbryantia formatexigens DSM 14469]|uniref:DNA-binding helix-turn-helix protein n=1 Tax=Marvinbryantia formatexigens DSM 14469 TaxID=478749 RepID=C6LHL3_9FIRM|nr:zinc ribbon domain-containing protein [Marvinbryantia formatexigens]EET60000.1 DNA-binding helix-turn-helix protein [Marvinbryantia formatexigens DSM 14469]UWO25849.1 zinc ribbon domain-containing protein [Marvinbryantia formatexigens DSM 14469]SDF40070.1 DNA-binding transcriptional regulator, XRE-family HTH domain [Marvinbryantia formatexigens]